jgi:DNA (cytosine-5)-methyltransferase 1
MNALELFSGCGGLALGMKKAGFNPVKLVEFNKHACASLRDNFGSKLVFEGDVRDFDYVEIDDVKIVAGGPPCQPFSLGGKHKGVNDERDMFPSAIKAIHELSPECFVFENVKGLLRESFSDYFKYILLRLSYPSLVREKNSSWVDHYRFLKRIESEVAPEYHVQYKLLNALEYGVPQSRQRVFIVGFKKEIGWKFPESTHTLDALLWSQLVTGKYWEKHGTTPNYDFNADAKRKSLIQKYGFLEPEHKAALTVRDALHKVPDPKARTLLEGHNFQPGAKVYPGHTGSFIDLPSKTIKAGDHGVPGGENMIRYRDGSVRYFSAYEAKIIQTFPSDYLISGSWGESLRQIGNAVPVTLATVIASSIYEKLNNNE